MMMMIIFKHLYNFVVENSLLY